MGAHVVASPPLSAPILHSPQEKEKLIKQQQQHQSLKPSKLQRVNEQGHWRLHAFCDLNLSLKKKKVGRLRSHRRLTCPPLPPTRDHARLSCREAVKVPADEQTLRDDPRNDGTTLRPSNKRRHEVRRPSTWCASCDVGLERRGTGRNSYSLETCCWVGGVPAHPVGVAADWNARGIDGKLRQRASTVSVYGDSEHWARGCCAGGCLTRFSVNVVMARSSVWACMRGLDSAQAAPATRRLGHHCRTGNCTQVLSSYFPELGS